METMMERVLDRRIAGAVNFRDIGGYPARGGRVRWGRVYRSGLMHAITRDGLAILANELGVRTVIDLRTPAELQAGLLPLAEYGIRHVHASLLDVADVSAAMQIERVMAMFAGTYDWAGSYLAMVESSPAMFQRVFETLAEAGTLPAVVQCSGGRDRTGVTIALLLAVLGVAPETIAADYALTGDALLPHLHHFASFAAAAGYTLEDMARLVRTTPDAMLAFLARIEERYGSAEGALLAAGVRPATIAALREALLE
ncbi:MAG: tyrosine-protein phosphatase [Chloroflexota bacterium]|nr:tyrosine-protein phosphatase [Dehalococcoidia bacterium]MDW8252471.1 tyrosine-protein phosphatase [Chloroflexota bacterium]